MKYDGADSRIHLYTRTVQLKVIQIHSETFSQWSWRRTMRKNLENERMSQAAVFITDLSCDRRYDEMPASVVLPLSRWEMTRRHQ